MRAALEDGGAVDENTAERSATPQADSEAPTFAGAVEAASAGSAEVELRWEPAVDNLTPAEAMVYQAFWSTDEGQAVRGILGAVSLPGATSVKVSGLPEPEGTFYFHVKAVDAAGNTFIIGRTWLTEFPKGSLSQQITAEFVTKLY